MPYRIHRLPSNQHRHHSRLSCTRRQFQRHSQQFWISFPISTIQIIKNFPLCLPQLWSHFRQPNRRLHCLNLTEKRTNRLKWIRSPMLQKPRSFRCHSPIARVRQLPPKCHFFPNQINNRGRIVLLRFSRDTIITVQNQLFLNTPSRSTLLRLRNRSDKLSSPSSGNDLIRGLTILI